MLSHLFTQLMRSFGIFFRTIRAFFTRKLTGIWARFKRFTNFSRQATKVASDSLQSVATVAKKPTSRGDFLETKRLFVSKKLLLTIAVGLAAFLLVSYLVIWPFILGHFLTAHFYVEDSRVENWTGRVVVYSDAEKTIPFYEGKLEAGKLQGVGKEYDEAGLVSYEGDFVTGVREGTGKLYEEGQLRYEGDFSADVQCGEGTAYAAEGNMCYKGSFADGLYEGEGTAYDENEKRVYQGSFSQGLYNGTGSLYPADNQRIDAEFADGVPNGVIKWYKNELLYYDGAAVGTMPEGFGTLYSPDGKTAYVGQMKAGTVDGGWLLTLTAEQFREALGEKARKEYSNVSGGFMIASSDIGLSALCSYQTADSEAVVHTVYLFTPQQICFALLPEQDFAVVSNWAVPIDGSENYQQLNGVNLTAGVYTSKSYTFDTYRADVLRYGEQAVLLRWELYGEMAKVTDTTADAAAAAAAEQEQLKTFLDSLNAMAGTGAVAAGTENAYCGSSPAADALSGCTNAENASTAVGALLRYWENAEKRTAAEGKLTRTKELLSEAQNALKSGTGDSAVVSSLSAQQSTLENDINTCITEMAKAAMEATSAGSGAPENYALSQLSVLFNPATLVVDDLTLVATAYAQSTAGETPVDSDALTLSLKTALVDLTTAYSNVQNAQTACEQAATAATNAGGGYAMGTKSKTEWYQAIDAQADSQAALYAAMSAFTQQVNALNALTGGWVSRTQGWLTDRLLPLYNAAATVQQ